MKKMRTLIFVITFAILTFTGCSSLEGNVTPDLNKSAQEVATELLNLRIATDDDEAFWSSADKVSGIVSEIMEEKRPMIVGFVINRSDGTTTVLEDFCMLRIDYINDIWLQKAANELIYRLASDEHVTAAHEAGQTVEIISVIFRWAEHGPYGNETKVYSTIDLNADGQLDYVVEGKLAFTTEPGLSLVDNNGRIIGIANHINSNNSGESGDTAESGERFDVLPLIAINGNARLSDLSDLALSEAV